MDDGGSATGTIEPEVPVADRRARRAWSRTADARPVGADLLLHGTREHAQPNQRHEHAQRQPDPLSIAQLRSEARRTELASDARSTSATISASQGTNIVRTTPAAFAAGTRPERLNRRPPTGSPLAQGRNPQASGQESRCSR
jgi:hypothetical protein